MSRGIRFRRYTGGSTQRFSWVFLKRMERMNLLEQRSHISPARTEAWFTRKEAASYLRLGESTLAKLFVSGDGPQAVKIGRSVRYSSIDLDNWMTARRRRSTSDTGAL